jgi:hypothetical protein
MPEALHVRSPLPWLPLLSSKFSKASNPLCHRVDILSSLFYHCDQKEHPGRRQLAIFQHEKEQVMGNRDKRGREKKKPKKKESRETIRPVKPAAANKPAAPSEPGQTVSDSPTSEAS